MNDSATSDLSRADLWALLFALVLPSVLTLVYFVWLADYPAPTGQLAYGGSKVVQFGFPLVWILIVRRQRLRWAWPKRRGLAEGVAFGLFVLVAMLTLYRFVLEPAGVMEYGKQSVGRELARFDVASPLRFFALGAFVSVAHSLLEEYYWRWFVFGGLRRVISFWPAVLVSSLGFMAHHVILLGRYFGEFSLQTLLFSLAVAVGGGVWAWIYHRSGSLLGPWISHLLVDVGVFLVGYQMIGGGP